MTTGLRGSLPLRSVGGFQHHCEILWAVSTLITKAYIAASCHGVVRRFVRHRWRVLDPHVSLVWFLVSFTGLVTVTRYFPSRVLTTISPFCSSSPASQCHSRCGQMRLRVSFLTLLSCIARGRQHALLQLLLSSVFLLNANPSSLSFACCRARSFCRMRPSLLTWLGTSAVGGGSASVEITCTLTTLVLQARLAPFPRLPVLGAFHALFLSSSPARDLQQKTWQLRFCLLEVGIHCTWRLSCCLLEVGHQQNLDLVASHRLGHLCFSWHVCCNSTTVFYATLTSS